MRYNPLPTQDLKKQLQALTDENCYLGAISLSTARYSNGVSLFYRADDLGVSSNLVPGGHETELIEATPLACQTSVMERYGDLRLSGITETLPELTLGTTFHLTFPEVPAAVFNPSGQRLL